MYYEVGHDPCEVGGETNVEEHKDNVKHLLYSVSSRQIPVANGREGGDGVIHGIGVTQPDAPVFEVIYFLAKPGILFVLMADRQHVIYTCHWVHCKQRHLQ